MRAFVKRYRVVAFFALALVLGWSPWWTGGAGFIAGGVSLAGLIVAAVAEGRQGLLDLLRRAVRWRAGLIWYAVPLLLPAAVALAAIGIHVLVGGTAPALPFLRQEWRQKLSAMHFVSITCRLPSALPPRAASAAPTAS